MATGRGRSALLALAALGLSVTSLLLVVPAAAAPRAPGVPGSVSVVSGNGSVTVKWGAAASNGSAVSGYVVTPLLGSTELPPVSVGGSVYSVVVPGLVNGSSYSFEVAARNAAGQGPDARSVPVVVGVPGGTAFPSVVGGNASAKVSWWAASGNGSPVVGYVVTPVVGSTELTPRVFNSTATTQTVTGLTNGTTYKFKIAAFNVFGTGPATTTPAAVIGLPGAPGSLSVVSGNGSVTVKWGAAASNGSAVSGYVVTPVLGSTELPPVSVAGSVYSVVVPGLVNGSSYSFKVVARNAAGSGPVAVSSAVVVGLPGGTAFPSVVGGNASAKVSWWAASGNGSPVVGYVVTPVVGTTELTPRVFNSTAATQTLTGLANGTTYKFKIAAFNAIGTGPPATTAAVTIGIASPPSKVVAALGSPGTGTATLTITPVAGPWPDVTSYLITPYRNGVAQTPTTTSTASLTQPVSGLAAGSSYTFSVAAINAAGTGPSSAPSNAITPVAVLPGTPTAVAARPGNGKAFLTWTAPAVGSGPPITGYVVTPYTDGVAEPAQTFADPSTTEVVVDLANDQEHTFTVAAMNVHGTGPASAPSSPVTPTEPPAPHLGATIDILGDSITAESHWGRDPEFAEQGQPVGTDTVKVAGMGFKVSDVLEGERERVQEVGRPTVMVVALGTNDASPDGDGWTTADEVAFQELFDVPNPVTCEVVVLPGYAPWASPARKAADDRARVAIARLAHARPRTIVVDWAAVIAAHPEYIDPDGIHLDSSAHLPGQLATPAAADAFAAMIWSGVAQCPPDTLEGGPTTGFAELAGPAGVAVDAAGNIVVADMLNNRVVRLSPEGVQTTLPFVGLSNPAGVAVDRDGNVLVADTSNDRVVRLSPDGELTTLAFTGLSKPVGVTVDPDGDVLVADTLNGRVVQLDPAGVESVVPFAGLSAPVAVVVDEHDDIVVSDLVNDQVVRLAADGTQTTLGFVGLDNPLGLAIGPDGEVIVADMAHHRVVRLAPDGTQAGLALGGGANPTGVALAPDGTLYVADSSNNRILTFPG